MKIRINQDVTFNWKLTVEGESVDLSKLELSVEITTPSNKKTEITPTIKFDTLEFNYRPKQIGEYILSAYLNRFKDGETALDIKAFEGVKYTWNQDFSIDDNLEANYVELEGNFGPKSVTYLKITYADLVNLRDTSKLTSGMFYRITDYITTTTQAGTKSAGHPFDVVVLALSERELSEQAWAIHHNGDTYFANNDLSGWKIWYCLDNDTTRFEWADETNGKGVIYRMIDEFNNDVPYDFKNIQFNRVWDSIKSAWSIISKNNVGVPCYTFSSVGDSSTVEFTDMSLSISNNVYSNVIKEYINIGKQTLNNNCFFGINCYSNTFGIKCYSNTFGNECKYNSFENNCYSNTFGNECQYNSFEDNCYSNKFGNSCMYNTFGSNCHSNKFGNEYYSNTFGNYCNYNTFGNSCMYNTFGNMCFGNELSDRCENNTFENNCYGNILRGGCEDNAFGNYCNSNTFGSNCDANSFYNFCQYNTFGSNCDANSFGNGCIYIKFTSDKDSTTKYNFYQGNHFGDDCTRILLKGAETASSESQVQNYNFAQGLQGTSDNYITVDGKRGRSYETKVAKNSNGELKIYCEADSIQ